MAAVFGDPPPPPPNSKPSNRNKKTPQEILSEFWDKFHTKKPGKVTTIFPKSLYKAVLPHSYPAGAKSSRNAAESYEAAAKECREKVKRIVRECHRTNEKFTDPDFDIERDPLNNCLNGLVSESGIDDAGGSAKPADAAPTVSAWEVKSSLETLAQSQALGSNGTVPFDANALSRLIGSDGDSGYASGGGWGSWANPGSVHRIDWIFESPQFTVNGYSSSDIKQGGDGDCWWLAAVATIAHRKDLMEKVCVARDEECGVYGFVFQRDGEWISTVVDDNLYLTEEDFDYYGDVYDATGKKARRHRKEKQTGSEALLFAHCADPNETWLPLLEKAYAKAHGDYEAISGGWPGEGVEDMTGGVTTTIESNRVLSKDKLWKELTCSDGDCVFALAAMSQGWDYKRSGLALGHAYSILQSREEVDEDGNKVRLVQIRNPWGQRGYDGLGEWNGSWSDGSKEWTPYWLKKLDYKFGDDGIFWMSLKDMLDNFMYIHRTRLFDEKWTVVQQWTSANISWITGYLPTKFEIEVKKAGLVVIVLTQLDDRYFLGFEGDYDFELHFLLQEVDAQASEHICRVRPVKMWRPRAVSCEVHLEPGTYEVLPKITAKRHGRSKPIEDVVKEYSETNPQKLRQVGMQYDLAHAKGGIPDEDARVEAKKDELAQKKKAKKQKAKERTKKKRAMTKAAKAMRKAADAIEDASKSDQKPSQAKKEGETKEDSAAIPETISSSTEQASSNPQQPGKPIESKPQPSAAPEAKSEAKPEQATTATSTNQSSSEAETVKDVPAPVDDKEVSETAVAEDTQAVEATAENIDEDVDEEESESASDSDSESETDDNDNEAPIKPWNAVAVIGLRVYARDPDVSIKLKEAAAEEATTLTVEGEPTGATI
ncbi:hypothetical protein PFICI_08271 [Pestalotiopsis fici W106-1]|uniref:Calpain catalytic domain-containing protein n=1 Tax=Pestalotiopsis fici (strain W106-1 / CGMCC3.15140) TaxID=1229662 RepID=W3X5V0_PESFW|nr:uncharacterized protein PFICI_08271 [Pestalotiopsis fici W106-1]ETS80742.1 hypothetical protein PFICI_08271 [Pestalotiopsis fici W106-1]